jgi:hypothetical protein
VANQALSNNGSSQKETRGGAAGKARCRR